MTSQEIRDKFLNFFDGKKHKIVPSAPIVLKNDPTLMFTNAGMNQFKDFFLGTKTSEIKRIADTQKCLRVSGKHNDLEEVGKDTYHHTMFEMLGNWSFGDYFKKEAIKWAWELLTEVYHIKKDRLYVTIFEGDHEDNLPEDTDAYNFWLEIIGDKNRIIRSNKKDNFWEMGDTGPCGPCSEIHYDLRSDAERSELDGATLVNKGLPTVVEFWNLVFIQYNRKADGTLEQLPEKHIDTGMGFERLCMILQGKESNYDTDVFTPLIKEIEAISKKVIGKDELVNVAIRVAADHIRAISFTIADGQLPSNTGAGYVIRRILRRAVRYGYSYLDLREPFLYKLVPVLAEQFKNVFPELKQQQDFVAKVIQEEENSFLRTLETGLKRLSQMEASLEGKVISGEFVFELYDTYGFPADLTRLIAEEKGLEIDEQGFEQEMEQQKNRSRQAAAVETGDWTHIKKGDEVEFVGYDVPETRANILKYRKVKQKNHESYQLVLDKTPFYAESGGQIGDTGFLEINGEQVKVLDTKKENELIVHYVDRLPSNPEKEVIAKIDEQKRISTANNHSATHLLHAALKQVLGDHVNQRGSYVGPEYLRFDFSHFEKVNDAQIKEIEAIVNEKIQANLQKNELRNVPIAKAMEMGATALFGEKYGDYVRVIEFEKDFSVELCGGIHVPATGQIGLFKITSESAVAAGVRRIEAITGKAALDFLNNKAEELKEIGEITKNNKDIKKGIYSLIEENTKLRKELEKLSGLQVNALKEQLKQDVEQINGINFIGKVLDLSSADALKNLAFDLKREQENLFFVAGAVVNEKPLLTIIISDNLVKERNLNAGNIIREIAKDIKGGGGGQPFYATAGGSDASGLQSAIEKAKAILKNV